VLANRTALTQATLEQSAGHGGRGGTIVPLVIAAPPRLPFGQRLDDTFTVQNFGEFPAHYQSLGIEIDDPSGASPGLAAARAERAADRAAS